MPDAADPTPPDADQRATDERQAQAEVQNLLQQTQTQALYSALVAARTEVARLTRENAALRAKAEPDESASEQ